MRAPGRSVHLQKVKEGFSQWTALKKAIPFIWPRAGGIGMKLRVVVALFMLLAAKLVDLSKPVTLKWMIDSLASDHPSLPIGLIVLYGFVGFLVTFIDDARGIIFAKVAAELERKIALETFVHLQSLSLRFHLEKKSGSILRSVSRGASSFATVMRIVLFQFLSITFQVVVVVGYLLIGYEWPYAAVTCAVIVVYSVFSYFATEHRDKLRREMNAKDNEFNQKAVDALLNFETVKYFNSEQHEAERYDTALKDYRAANIKTQQTQSWISIGQQTFLACGVTAVMFLAGREVVAGTMTLGSFLLVQQFIITLYKPLGDLGRIYRQIKNSLVDVEAMFELFNETVEVIDTTDKKMVVKSGSVEFRNVYFGYDTSRMILKNVSFNVAPGESVAIVGSSGAGKSTITSLLYRFYDIQSGGIYIDKQNIKEVTQQSLRANIGIVPQDCVLFNDSIGYNIGYGIYGRKPEGPTQADIESASEQAQIDKFIKSQDNGYELQVGERGLRISGGEKQRVAIARAILKDSKIMIFDEATSSLDTHTEQEILKEMDTLSQGRSSITIAHRLSTIVNSDKILVLKNGEIVESGTHISLLDLDGEYKRMWEKQIQKDHLENEMEKLQAPCNESDSKEPYSADVPSSLRMSILSPSISQTSCMGGGGGELVRNKSLESIVSDGYDSSVESGEEGEFDDTVPLLEMQRVSDSRRQSQSQRHLRDRVIDIDSKR